MGIVGKIGEMCWDEGKIEKNTDRRLAGSTDGYRERWVDGRMDAQRMMGSWADGAWVQRKHLPKRCSGNLGYAHFLLAWPSHSGLAHSSPGRWASLAGQEPGSPPWPGACFGSWRQLRVGSGSTGSPSAMWGCTRCGLGSPSSSR